MKLINNLEMKSIRALLFIPGVPCARDTTEVAEGGGAWAGVLPICRPDFYTHSPGIFWGSGSTVKLQMPRLSGGQPSLLHLGVLAETAPPNPGHRPLSLRFSLSQGGQVCTYPASLEAWALVEAQPHPPWLP